MIIFSFMLFSDCLECYVLIHFQENRDLKVCFKKKAEKNESSVGWIKCLMSSGCVESIILLFLSKEEENSVC